MTRTMEEQRDGQKPEMKLGLKIVGDDALEPINWAAKLWFINDQNG